MHRKAPIQIKRTAIHSSPSSSSDDEDGMSRKLQPKVKRMTMRSSSSDDEDERIHKFRRFSLKLNADIISNERMLRTPPQLAPNSPQIGSPKKIWKLLCRKDELYRKSDFLFKHPQIKPMMRSMLYEWLMEVCEDRRLHRETFHLSVDYTDRFLSNTSNIPSSRLQLIGATALVIASKMEEIYPPTIQEFADFTAGGCKAEDIIDLETTMLQKLDWSCAPVTSVHWLALYLQLMGHNETISDKQVLANLANTPRTPKSHLLDTSTTSNNDHDYFEVADTFTGNTSYSEGHIYVDQRCTVPKLMRDEFVRLARILDLCILDMDSLQFTYSELAAAILLTTFEPKSLIEQITGFRSNQLIDVCEFVEPFIKVCEKIEPPGCPIPQFEDVQVDDAHNIQVVVPDAMNQLTNVCDLRKDISTRRKAAQASVMRYRRKRLLN